MARRKEGSTMSDRKYKVKRGGTPRRIVVRGVRRDPVDLRKLSRALIALAAAQAEADARADGERQETEEHRKESA